MTKLREDITISREVARRFLSLHHHLAPPRSLPSSPASVLSVVKRLGSLQFDPLQVTGRNHDLVLLARIKDYQREWTESHLYETRELFEAYNKGLSILPTSELPLYRITWDRARARHDHGSFNEHAPLVNELLERVRDHGPLTSSDVARREDIDWYWGPTNPVRAILEALAEAGVLALAKREGNRRIYDLTERLFDPALLERRPHPRDQFRHKLLSRYRAHGLLGTSGSGEVWLGTSPHHRDAYGLEGGLSGGALGRRELLAELVESKELHPVRVEGIRNPRYVLREERDLLARAEAEIASDGNGDAERGVALLAPLDPLVWDRDFLRQCYDFDYVWEVYVPAAKRRWGYYVLPILFGDQIVGRVEPRFERASATLRISGLWWEESFDPLGDERFVPALAEALDALGRFGGVKKITWPRTKSMGPISAALRERLTQLG